MEFNIWGWQTYVESETTNTTTLSPGVPRRASYNCDAFNINMLPALHAQPYHHMHVDDVFLAPTIPVRGVVCYSPNKPMLHTYAPTPRTSGHGGLRIDGIAGRTACASVQFQGAGTAALSVATF